MSLKNHERDIEAKDYCMGSLTRKVQRVPFKSFRRLILDSVALDILHLLILTRHLPTLLFAAAGQLRVCISIPCWINRLLILAWRLCAIWVAAGGQLRVGIPILIRFSRPSFRLGCV